MDNMLHASGDPCFEQGLIMKNLLFGVALAIPGYSALAAPGPDCSAERAPSLVTALDTEYQAAVAKNDVSTMGRLLADDYILITGRGKVYTKADLLAESKRGSYVYERLDDTRQTVRVWGKTAVLTALLWVKGTEDGRPFEYRVWFSDTYVCTGTGWRYTFARSVLPWLICRARHCRSRRACHRCLSRQAKSGIQERRCALPPYKPDRFASIHRLP